MKKFIITMCLIALTGSVVNAHPARSADLHHKNPPQPQKIAPAPPKTNVIVYKVPLIPALLHVILN
ncbi:MAG: hypothetical protein LUB59_06680 [Candidatus Gastranaerophilales bacterium]|nr:hypothetical protein [Candidatus Gastranaerophilales bacterium]